MQIGAKTLSLHPAPKPAAGSPVTNSAPMDSVELTSTRSQAFVPAAHLQRATREYLDLVPTHPTERDEFVQAAEHLRAVMGDILYGGHWPEPEEMPSLPASKPPGDPARNGGLSRSEQLVSDDLIAIYRQTSPAIRQPQQHKLLAHAIHQCQSGLQSRVLRRDYPNYWMSTPGSLQEDAQREMERWGTR